ncbi:hypothetical protein MUU53_14045 [Rhizobium lemnae]|uniref:Chorismate lyase n=1 Tax=Rhizobium lemnae TaxID=1214924 RepID=A0ABV8E7Y4_9HYPH|nr:hypothetical protein [Rhizobium lemnae]MCJ8509035.1 hypothetical protein [Rhizobium lemnae]
MTVLFCIIFGSQAHADATPKWPDTPVMRLQALAVLQTLNSELLSNDSATLTLDRWCEKHGLAQGQKVRAERDKSTEKPVTAEIRSILKVNKSEPVAYRRVRLVCGERILSEADNWYVPSRLTEDMNKALNGSDAPFGRVVQPLKFQRHTVAAELLWQPLPERWEMGIAIPTSGGASLEIPSHVLRHKAFLTTADGIPFSTVVENYTAEVLAFKPQPFSPAP